MSIISRIQMDAFDSRVRESFCHRLAGYVRAFLPDQTKHFLKPDLESLIIDAEMRANRYGIATERGIAKWVCISLLAGQRFDEIPEVNLVLAHAQTESERRLDLLFESLCFMAQRNY